MILHIDMDAFFASVEQLDHPEYRGKPVVVGGDPQSRGVVSTASYEARQFGIRSAMPAAEAYRLCPDAIFIRPRMTRYQEVSAMIMGILRHHAQKLLVVSVDEAYLDVTHYPFGSSNAVMIARLIKQNIQAITHLTASAGVAPNMFLAKIASEFQKPDGLTVIAPDQVEAFLRDLPVRKIPGVGPVTESRLQKMGIHTCSDLQKAGHLYLHERLGKQGIFLYKRALGIDEREVESDGEARQSSTEETFARDVLDVRFLQTRLELFAHELYAQLQAEGRMGRTVVLKLKYFDFELITRSQTLGRFPQSAEDIYAVAENLLTKKTLAGKKPVRLIGLGLSGLGELSEEPAAASQLELNL